MRDDYTSTAGASPRARSPQDPAAGSDRPPFELLTRDPEHPELELWEENTGSLVQVDAPLTAGADLQELDLVSWNVAIGEARLEELFRQLRKPRADGSGAAAPPLVLLLQEVYRADATVPERLRTQFHGGKAAREGRSDIVAFARRHHLSLRYAPSMRNGAHRSDRGNAVLSTLALGPAFAFALPYVRQRRVVVAAALARRPELLFVSAHLDTWGLPRGGPWLGAPGAGRAAQAHTMATRLDERAPGATVVVGADLNSTLGARDPALRELLREGFSRAPQTAAWEHTFHGPVRLLLDHILLRDPGRRIDTLGASRLDETVEDRGWRIFGSDHHPLLARIQLAGAGSASH